MTTKGPSRKHIIVPMSNENKMKSMEDSSTHITNINRGLKGIKSEVMADFICSDQVGITIVMNKVASSLNFQTIENYVKNVNCIKADSMKVSQLLESKSYLKIIDIPYLVENINTPITANVVEAIIKKNHIFNNIALALRPWIIKVSSKSDMAIIWLDIWDVQSGNKVKGLINRYFNIGSYINTIHKANINPVVP